MNSPDSHNESVLVLGMGCVVPMGIGCLAFDRQLREPVVEPSRIELEHGHSGYIFELSDCFDFEVRIAELGLDSLLAERILKLGRRGSLTVQTSLLATAEAWKSAGIKAGDDVGLILAGNNFDQLAGYGAARDFAEEDFASPMRAMTWLDGHILGALSEAFGITGPGIQVGGSSAAGLIGVHQALSNIRAGLAETWVVVAPPMVLSPVEWSALANVGALAGLDVDPSDVSRLCVPFDKGRQGFVPSLGSAAVVLARDNGQTGIVLLGGGICMDAHARMEPSAHGEARAMMAALSDAKLTPSDIAYVNTHGTGSIVGDPCEADALYSVFGSNGPAINATKGLIGHCLTSAGLIEFVATCLQMTGEYRHGNPHLRAPLSTCLNFVGSHSEPAETRYALCNSYAFGGVNASMALFHRKRETS